ncbi:MAG: PEP-CTERM sorting domain-containing protein [Planctomycetota bacterium]|nr:MAG: PEP-CTERM sorting domain-containing protein [Planctomycetota bacterium]
MRIDSFEKWMIGAAALVLGLATAGGVNAGPYAPAAGQPGSTAIWKEDPAIVAWASGYLDYVPGTDVADSWKTPLKALGPAVGDSFDIVCLGRGGRITLTFDAPITDGPGWDFAVFENSFSDTFLELAYVEVSSNGVDFFRFENDSQTPSAVGAFGFVDPTNIDGLAGKYRQGYGTPFDLSVLDGVSPLLDTSAVRYVRLIDIVGDGSYLDTSGDAIYDPYPTSGSAGFDLDAIGVANVAPVPEPSAWAALVSGGMGLGLWYRRRRRKA